MILKIFCIYDSKSEAYHMPFFSTTVGQAERSFSDAVVDNTTTFSKHPEDYTLFYCGDFDDSTAEIKGYKLVSLGTALEYRARANGCLPGNEG